MKKPKARSKKEKIEELEAVVLALRASLENLRFSHNELALAFGVMTVAIRGLQK